MRKPTFILMLVAPVLFAAVVALTTGCASAQVGGAASSAASPPAKVAPDSTGRPRGFSGFTVNFRASVSSSQLTAEYPSVAAVRPGAPADKAGLVPGDVILEVNGTDARTPKILNFDAGVKYVLRIRRGAQEREITLVPILRSQTIPARPEP